MFFGLAALRARALRVILAGFAYFGEDHAAVSRISTGGAAK